MDEIDKTINQARQNKNEDEINKILNELPIEDRNKPLKKIKKNKLDLSKIFSNKYFKYGLIVAGLLFLLIIFIPTDCNCSGVNNVSDCPNTLDNITFDSIKHQILNKGYVELNENDLVIKLSPYLK